MKDKAYRFFFSLGTMSGCHQLPERSFFIRGKQFPICARCTGCLIGYIIGTVLYFLSPLPIWLDVLFCAIMFIDWFIQHMDWKPSTNLRRLITGILCGTGLIQLYLLIFGYIVTAMISHLS